jgi:hypothetical protein
MNLEPILIHPARGPAYLWQPRNWDDELVEFLEKESLSAKPRLAPGRIAYYRESARDNNIHMLLAEAQIEAAGWLKGGGS